MSKLDCGGDWYLLRAKSANDSNFFVREVGLERSLEIAEVLRGEGRCATQCFLLFHICVWNSLQCVKDIHWDS